MSRWRHQRIVRVDNSRRQREDYRDQRRRSKSNQPVSDTEMVKKMIMWPFSLYGFRSHPA
jgi:hypothetical protein